MMQRTFGILTLVTAAALAACGDKQEAPSAAQTAASEATTSAQQATEAAASAAQAASAVVETASQAASAADQAAQSAGTAVVAAGTAAAASADAGKAAAPAAAGDVDLAAGEKLYKTACFVCHDAGIAGAPKLGDKEAWAPRLAQGDQVLIKHSIDGYTGLTGVMPPRGASTASDEEMKNAVIFMTSKVR